MYDFHCHTTMSDGELLPTELLRRLSVLGYTEVAISDHADFSNVEALLSAQKAVKKSAELFGLRLYSGIEITHVPPEQIDELAGYAKALGAEIVVVHGETVSEPVAPGTNMAALSSSYVDILAHPGLITEEEARLAARNNIYLEITARGGHNRTNGHVVFEARRAGASLVVESDAHGPDDLLSEQVKYLVARGAGMREDEAKTALSLSADEVRNL
ncbi:histidinol phosphate phosphatase domain-containing protein [Methanorbis furvi]|uniref:DNA polymerase/3'-5' exonuclease PolX n=1 Tax=Methanorbis furvi TaxID=3028299 RepID=A0AAE4MCT4_9EURY|nr:DNA polymerase/3'-5' exonuclease PolX [Methanocorpusculaceae archaeon Ag1]